MELRILARKNTILSLNKQTSINSKIESNKNDEVNKENICVISYPYQSHHAFQYLRGTYPSEIDFKKFVSYLYKGLYYGVKCLKGPS